MSGLRGKPRGQPDLEQEEYRENFRGVRGVLQKTFGSLNQRTGPIRWFIGRRCEKWRQAGLSGVVVLLVRPGDGRPAPQGSAVSSPAEAGQEDCLGEKRKCAREAALSVGSRS